MTIIAASKRLPDLTDVGHLFTMLFGAEAKFQSRKQPLPSNECAIVAEYQAVDGNIKRLLVCDLAFANSAGAALSMISPGLANGATKSNKFADATFDNLSEVMNIAVNLFTESYGGRLELARLLKWTELSPEIESALGSTVRTKVDVTIPRYEIGRVDLIALS